MGEEDGGEVDVRKVTTGEVPDAVAGEAFDPFGSRGKVTFWIVSVGVSVTTAHGRWIDLI